jgi:hypothetical protein
MLNMRCPDLHPAFYAFDDKSSQSGSKQTQAAEISIVVPLSSPLVANTSSLLAPTFEMVGRLDFLSARTSRSSIGLGLVGSVDVSCDVFIGCSSIGCANP